MHLLGRMLGIYYLYMMRMFQKISKHLQYGILYLYQKLKALRWDALVMLQLAVEALDALYCYLLV